MDVSTTGHMIKEHIVFYGVFIIATKNTNWSCTLTLYYLLKVSILQTKASHIPGFGILPETKKGGGEWTSNWLFQPSRKAVSCNIHPGRVVASSWVLPFPVF